MKKTILKITLILMTAMSLNNLNAQAVEQGNIIIDPYYGFPNFGKSLSSQIANGTNVKVQGIGPAGLRFEYMLSDRIGVGVDGIYNSNIVSGTVNTQVWNEVTNEYNTVTHLDRFSMQRIRVQARFNFHFNIDNPNLDSYFGVGAGTNNRIRSYTRDGVDMTHQDDLSNFTLLPFSMRLCTGIRYYFSDNIGANMELGLGGPLVSLGLSLKF